MPFSASFFDEPVERRGSDSFKWGLYANRGDVLPLWVADMDFRSDPAITDALVRRAREGVYGYAQDSKAAIGALIDHHRDRYGFAIDPAWVVPVPGLVCGLNVLCRAVGKPGDAVATTVPVYPPFLEAPTLAGRSLVTAPMTRDAQGRPAFDRAALEAALTPATRLFILCNPHNPVGRVYTAGELERLAEICLRRNVLICSDEIHCDLIYSGHRHVPIASLQPEIAQNSITLMAPSKTFNIPGLQCSFAVVQNPELRQRLQKASEGMGGWVNLMGLVAGQAAYQHGQEWLGSLMTYLQGNRDFLFDFVNQRLPGVRMAKPEGTYLGWLDCREAGIDGNPYEYFLQKARVAVNDGKAFGSGGEGFVRLNFGCPRSMLEEALSRMEDALHLPVKKVDTSLHGDPFGSH